MARWYDYYNVIAVFTHCDLRKKDPQFYLKTVLDWVDPSQHKSIKEFWPPNLVDVKRGKKSKKEGKVKK